MAQLDLRMEDLRDVSDDKKLNILKAKEKLEAVGQDLMDTEYFSQDAQAKRMDNALNEITRKMDERLAGIMSKFDEQLDELKELGADFPDFETWQENFDEDEWRAQNPEEAAKIDAML